MINKIIDWTGAVALAIAPFLIDYSIGKILAIIGLILLSYQAYRNKLLNLLFLNAIGIVGYTWSFLI